MIPACTGTKNTNKILINEFKISPNSKKIEKVKIEDLVGIYQRVTENTVSQ